MKQGFLRRAMSLLLMVAMLVSLVPAVFATEDKPETRKINVPDGKLVISETNYPITKGVTETQVILNNNDGNAQVYGYFTTVEPGASVKFKASYGGYYSEGSTPESRAEAAKNLKWDLRTTTGQAADYENATGETVIAATNADYYNMQTGQCLGHLIMEGNLIQTQNSPETMEPYFAVLKDGTYAIRDFNVPCDDVEEAISGPFFIIRNGVLQLDDSDKSLAPRNSIGLKADGTVVTFLADGRAGISNGMSVYEVAQMMLAQGVVDAIYLDGGGSATLATRHEGGKSLEIRNHPSDGPERVVASSLLLVSTEKETGVFDHAALSPKNDIYVAGCEVQFTANGVDASGFPAQIPTSAKWRLADSSFGTIDQTGLFKSNGKCGTIAVELAVGNKVVGETEIQVQEPTSLYFEADSINLAFRVSSDLGLVAKYDTLTMKTDGMSFEWNIESKTEGVTADGIGSFEGNIFTTVKAKQTLNATITVSYKKTDGTVLTDSIDVEIGRMPQVIWDFEADENGHVGKGVGQYDWGDSSVNPEGFVTDEPLTFFAWDGDDTTGGVTTKTESGPFFFDGNYLSDETDVCRYPASSVFSAAGYDFYADHTSYMQDHSSGGDIVTAENGEVRFGDHALRLDYDYTNLKPGYRNVNMWLYPANAYGEDMVLEGTPTGLGFWVYAPEGTANFWLWLQIGYYDEYGALKRPYIHLKTQEGRNMQYTGIYWDGWMYVEADLTPYAKYVTPEHPLKIMGGMSFISLTLIPGGSANENGDKIPMGDFSKGSLYFDNFRVVYGDTVDDMQAPVINSITANGTALGDETAALTSNTVRFVASFEDAAGDNATGIKTEKTALYIDGFLQELPESTESGATATVTLPNGIHSVMLSVSDGFGNVTKVTRYINVNAENSPLGSVSLSGEPTAMIGQDYELLLTAANSAKITSLSARIALNNTFGEPTVTFSEGYTGTASFENGILTLEAATEAPKSGTVATITFHIDPATARGALLTYEVKNGSFVDNGKTLTFANLPSTTGVTAAYEISTDVMMVNATGKIYVTKADGSAPGRVEIYRVIDGAEPELLGTTNASGVLVTNKLCQTVGENYTIYAKGESGYSFRTSGVTNGVGSDEVTPWNVRLNAVTDPTTTQCVTWFSAPEYTLKQAVLQYEQGALEKGVDDNYTTVNGTSKVYAFNGGAGDNNAALLNTVTVEGLQPGTTYRYRVGDGVDGHWSAWRQFTTSQEGADTSFFVLGDTQLSLSSGPDSDEVKAMEQIAEHIAEATVDFGIQTGDFIDVANSLPRWNQILGLFGDEYPSQAVIQVLGNHEYYGDTSANLASAIFNLPSREYYSVEYGDVYVAVINCNASIEAAAKWLVEDAAKSDCTWKVLTLHQPPYYTNPKGSSEPYNRTIPAAAEAAGIDFVFSGHDHAYARTEPIAAGNVDEKNGVVYFICGDLGEKSRSTEYAPENNPDFHFAKIKQDYEAVYLIVNTTAKKMTVTAYDLDGTVIDTYTKENEQTTIDPPEPEHTYVYNRAADKLLCSECGQPAPENYTGWATDKNSGKAMYFLGGTYKTGWFQLGFDLYHFDEKTGEAHKLEVLEDVPTTCGEQGYKKVRCECGETYTMEYALPAGHINEEYTNENGETYYVCTVCGRISKYNLTFADVEDTDWFAPYVDYVVREGLFNGRSAVRFDPNSPMTRSELVTVLWRNSGSPDFDNVHETAFTDCLKNVWYTAAVNWAAKNGIVNGVGENLFRPQGYITREQIVTILYRYASYLELDTTARAEIDKDFEDADSVSGYAQEAMSWAVAMKLIQGDNGKLKPLGNASRAQVATIVMRFAEMQKAAQQPETPVTPAE